MKFGTRGLYRKQYIAKPTSLTSKKGFENGSQGSKLLSCFATQLSEGIMDSVNQDNLKELEIKWLNFKFAHP